MRFTVDRAKFNYDDPILISLALKMTKCKFRNLNATYVIEMAAYNHIFRRLIRGTNTSAEITLSNDTSNLS